MLPGLDAAPLRREFARLMARAGLSISNVLLKTGGNLSGALNDARSTVALTATTSPIWAAGVGKIIDGTGTPVITDFPAAPQAGAQRVIYPPVGAIITNGGNISVQGNTSHTAAAGDKWVVNSLTTTTFDVEVIRKIPSATNRAYASYTTNTGLSTTIPFDNSIPQNTEGTQILSVTITPRSTTEIIRLRYAGNAAVSGGIQGWICALFNSSSANALAVQPLTTPGSNLQFPNSLEFEHVPGTLSAQTYSIRVGAQTDATYMNGTGSGRIGGGVSICTLIAEGFQP